MINRIDHCGGPEIDAAPEVGAGIVPMTIEMVPDVAELHLRAFAGYLNTRIGRTYLRSFMKWFCRAESAIALVAIDSSGKVIGYAVGAPTTCDRSMNRDLFWPAAAGIVLRPWLFLGAEFRKTILARLRSLLRRSREREAEPLLPAPTMSLVGIGVSPSARGKKVGLRLLRAFESRARHLKMRSLMLSVITENTVARQLYESCGWRILPGSGGEKNPIYYSRVHADESDWSKAGA